MSQIAADLKKGNIKSLYLFYGEEAFKRRHFKELLKEAVTHGDTMNFSAFEGKDINWQEVYDTTQTLPFFAEKRLVIVENSGKFKAGKGEGASDEISANVSAGTKTDAGNGTAGTTRAKGNAAKSGDLLERILTELPETTCLAFFEESAAKNKKTYKLIASRGEAVECGADTEEDLINWLARGFAREGKKVRRSTLELLTGRTGLAYDKLRMEFEKIVSYVGDRSVVEDADILAITTETIESRIFDLLSAMSEKNVRKVLDKYYDLLSNREHPLYIMAMLRSQLRTMLQISELNARGLSAGEIARAAGKPVFVVNKTKNYLRHFSRTGIEEMLDEISDTDRRCKSGEIQDQIGVELLLIRFSSV